MPFWSISNLLVELQKTLNYNGPNKISTIFRNKQKSITHKQYSLVLHQTATTDAINKIMAQ